MCSLVLCHLNYFIHSSWESVTSKYLRALVLCGVAFWLQQSVCSGSFEIVLISLLSTELSDALFQINISAVIIEATNKVVTNY